MDSNTQEYPWPHAPTHCLATAGTYFVTSGTYLKRHHFVKNEELGHLQQALLEYAAKFGWELEAWAVFSNHYHFVGHSPIDAPGAQSLRQFLAEVHSSTAKWLNQRQAQPGRRVWYNFWETQLTIQTSYQARLNYTHQNAVKHGLVVVAHQYPWCSARWFERTASPSKVRSIYSYRTDHLRVFDEFSVAWDQVGCPGT